MTAYGEKLDPTRPLPEYPRPQMVRDSYLNLNGVWRYAITREARPPADWDGDIVVPFSPESPLSGVMRVLQPDEFLWYQRTFHLPDGFLRSRLLLHFGAVDQDCTVLVNGHAAGSHRGGYLPFTLDITPFLREGPQEVTVMATDKTEDAPFARGYQRLEHGGPWHTPQSGIWQTVWLESVPEAYIKNLTVTPLFDEAAVEITVEAEGGPLEGTAQVFARSTLVTEGRFTAGQPLRLQLPGFLSWHPKMPFLYTLKLSAPDDAIGSYFGMRKLHVEADATGHGRLMLNNRPFLGAGVADQGLYSDGLYTAPSDRTMLEDIRFAKSCGFNMIRKLGKIEPLRWYHHCDKTGLLVWQDLPAGGKPSLAGGARPLPGRPRDSLYPLFGRANAAGREAFMQDMQNAAHLLHNVPCIGAWVIFQQGQGQFDAANAANSMKQWDPHRLVDHAAGWYDQGAGDIQSLYLTRKTRQKLPGILQKHDARACFITKAGNFGLRPADGAEQAIPYCGKLLATREELAQALAALYRDDLIPQKELGLCGFFLYQLADAEDEVSGLLSFDRRTQKLHPKGLATLNSLFLKQK